MTANTSDAIRTDAAAEVRRERAAEVRAGAAVEVTAQATNETTTMVAIERSEEANELTGATTTGGQDTTGQCRFCLMEDAITNLVQPCACTGSALRVHLHCLRRWQRRQSRSTCEVCQAEWSVPLDPLDRDCWLRSVKTNPHYRPRVPGAVTEELEARLRERMRPGQLIVQTRVQAERTEAMLERPEPEGLSVLGILASVLQRRSSHWFKGAYLILLTVTGGGSDQSDTICAVNLTRPLVQEPMVAELQALAGPDAVVGAIDGGPCSRDQPLVLLLVEAGGRSPRGDAFQLEGVVPPSGCELWVAEADVTKAWLAGGGVVVRSAMLVRGVAIWSSTQLIAEVSRLSWGLCAAAWTDLPFAPPAPDGERSASSLWSTCWAARDPMHAPPVDLEPPPSTDLPESQPESEAPEEAVPPEGTEEMRSAQNARRLRRLVHAWWQHRT